MMNAYHSNLEPEAYWTLNIPGIEFNWIMVIIKFFHFPEQTCVDEKKKS